MPAYLKQIIDRTCKHPLGCSRGATYELYNTHNALVGWYCYKHASQALERFQAEYERAHQSGSSDLPSPSILARQRSGIDYPL